MHYYLCFFLFKLKQGAIEFTCRAWSVVIFPIYIYICKYVYMICMYISILGPTREMIQVLNHDLNPCESIQLAATARKAWKTFQNKGSNFLVPRPRDF